MAKLKLWLMILGVLSVLATGAYLYIDNLLDENRVLKSENARQELVIANRDQAIAEQEKAIDDYQKQVEQAQLESMRYFRESAENRGKYEKAVERLGRHDRNYLALNKPGLVSNILEKENREIERCLELSVNENFEFTEAELNATKPSEINNFCWDEINPNFDPYSQSFEWQEKNLK